MFGLILFIIVLSFIVRLFSRPFYGYYRPWGYPFGGFGGWGMLGDILAIRFFMRLLPILCVISVILWAMN